MSYFNQLPIEELETSIDQYPDEPEVRAALIKRLAAEGDIDAAISQAFIADELIPDNSEIKVLKAFCLLQAGEFENGHELLQEILRNDPRLELHEQIATEIAPIFVPDAGDLTNPEHLQLTLPDHDLEPVFAERFESMLDIICTMPDESDEVINKLFHHIDRFPDDLSARMHLATLHVINGDEQLADPIYRNVIADDPQCASAYFELATIVKPEEAVKLTRDGLELCPGHTAGRFNLGLFLIQSGRSAEGRTELTRIPADSQHYSSALWAITESFELQNNFSEACKTAERLCALQPHEPSTHSNLGHLLCQQGNYDEAIEVLQRAIEIDPEHLDSLFNQAIAFTCVDRIDEAIERYEQRNLLDPNDAISLNNLGTLYSQTDRLNEAIEILERAHAVESGNELVCQNLGVFYCMISDFEHSMEFSNNAIELNPANSKAHWNLGCAYAKQGERELMMECLRTALHISPQMQSKLLSDRDLEMYWDDPEFIDLAENGV